MKPTSDAQQALIDAIYANGPQAVLATLADWFEVEADIACDADDTDTANELNKCAQRVAECGRYVAAHMVQPRS